MHQTPPRNTAKSSGYGKIIRVCTALLVTFYSGFQFGYQHCLMQEGERGSRSLASSDNIPPEYHPSALRPTKSQNKLYTEEELQERVKQQVNLFTKLHNNNKRRQEGNLSSSSNTKTTTKERRLNQQQPVTKSSRIFPQDTESFVAGMSLVDRDQFAEFLELGIPLDASEATNQQVLILHAKDALPANNNANHSTSSIPVYASVEEAVQNCNHVNLIWTEPHRHDQCLAIMGQYNSYHVQKYMRVPQEDDARRRRRFLNSEPVAVDKSLPLRLVPRGTDTKHAFGTQFPEGHQTRHYWNTTLRSYFNHLDSYLEDLRPLLKDVALCRAVIVMVCNQGQSDLLTNFVCSATARGLDLSGVLVFATDPETHQLARGLGLTSYYREELFHTIPKETAEKFGDHTYTDAIIAKVFCVQLVSMLGYDILFQDVDIVWYKDPLEYFQSSAVFSKDTDIYMQHDGNRAQFYAPYSGNTGFYYVKNNPRTQYFLNHFLVSGDLITATTTHQAPFLSLLSEHASLHGLKVKILPTDDYPGGYHFQDQPEFMKQFLQWKETQQANLKENGLENPASDTDMDPKIFHMSWTDNKTSKVQFLQQLGEWYVKNNTSCTASASDVTVVGASPRMVGEGGHTSVVSQCCSSRPIIKCHYRDKPSTIPCLDSPSFKTDASSFW